ncbi:MAG: NlpC/P60 family protein, partial [Bacteroidota bacterium]
PKESAEMISQLVFGEYGEILEEQEAWLFVQNAEDGYQGWVDKKMVKSVPQAIFSKRPEPLFAISGGLSMDDGSFLPLPPGARIPQSSESIFIVNNQGWKRDSSLVVLDIQPFSQVVEVAKRFLNTPYLWGGRSGWGIDCSGYSQLVYRICGKFLPRDSSKQALEGTDIEYGAHQLGDLAFFRKSNQERISHVGIIGDNNDIYHASGKVRLDFLAKNGILKLPTGNVTHILVCIKRY